MARLIVSETSRWTVRPKSGKKSVHLDMLSELNVQPDASLPPKQKWVCRGIRLFDYGNNHQRANTSVFVHPAPNLSVVLPCLNEQASLVDCIIRLKKALESSGLSGAWEIIVADNGSTDRSVQTAEQMGVRVVNVEERGYGRALSAGLHAAVAPHVVFVDADGTYPLELVSELYRQTLKSGAVLGVAS